MPTNLTIIGKRAFTQPVSGPSGGDNRNSASVRDALQPVVNQLLYLQYAGEGATDASNVQREISGAQPDTPTDGNWQHINGIWVQVNAVETWLELDLKLPFGVEVTAIRAMVQGSSGFGAHSALPANMPVLSFFSRDPSANAVSVPETTIATQTDSSANSSAYDAAHNISLILAETIDPSLKYWLKLKGEWGSNSVAGALMFKGVTVSWTRVTDEP